MSNNRFSLFPNGTSFMCWMDANCDRCWKGVVSNKTGKSRCAIENAIALASGTDGSLMHGGGTPPEKAAKVAARLGWDGVSYLENNCPEREEKRPAKSRKQKYNGQAKLL